MAAEKTERVQLVMSEKELAALDRWRHRRQIASRSEAIRQLIRGGIGKKGRKEGEDGTRK